MEQQCTVSLTVKTLQQKFSWPFYTRTGHCGVSFYVSLMLYCAAECSEPVTATWTHEATVMLIHAYQDHRPQFSSSACKKLDVWKRIAALLNSRGHRFTAEQCDKKMRSLRYRYTVLRTSDGLLCSPPPPSFPRY